MSSVFVLLRAELWGQEKRLMGRRLSWWRLGLLLRMAGEVFNRILAGFFRIGTLPGCPGLSSVGYAIL